MIDLIAGDHAIKAGSKALRIYDVVMKGDKR